MRLLIYITLLSFIYCVASKNNVKSLAESMGQEIIEIAEPVKELPPGLEEEQSAENDDEDKLSSNTILPATKKEIKKTTLLPETRRKYNKDTDNFDGVAQGDDEARIEKKLAEIYKDTPDYKAESAEPAKEKLTLRTTVVEVDLPIARQRTTYVYGDIDSDEYVVEPQTTRGQPQSTGAPFITSTRKLEGPLEVPSKKNSASSFIMRSTYIISLTTFIAFY